ncbi:protoheme IX farnesyltransferase [Verrucomicrobium sp. GAS474]|uniref:heme o synthase n=1 Tax=Verrucomicrobium sp. GAS474 TaxID=1882831 RepID=UPI00087C0C70|nr:heme o synthase [Verrucomicrobium sp. GAS474]SDU17305.1 protoheme IX farnesyltransferase [Verrucomicrobium sp. GAS474]
MKGDETAAAVEIEAPAERHTLLSDLFELVKFRLTFFNLMTTLAGFYLGNPSVVSGRLLLHTILATGLVAASASALNQVIERKHDARMARTASRPLPSGRRRVGEVFVGALLAGIGGTVWLALAVNVLSAVIAAATLLSYVLVYTPMKRHTTLNTLVGAIPGALPPVIGFTAARDEVGPQAYILFAILFLWQIPHFLAIAWLYRDEYRDAGFRMITGDDPQGEKTSRHSLYTAAALLPIGLLPTFFHIAGKPYFWGAVVIGGGYVWAGWRFFQRRDRASARVLFLASILYLPLLLGLMAYDAVK